MIHAIVQLNQTVVYVHANEINILYALQDKKHY